QPRRCRRTRPQPCAAGLPGPNVSRTTCPEPPGAPRLTPLTTSRTAPALPRTSLIGWFAEKSRDSPDDSRPSNSFCEPDVADTHLLPVATDSRTATAVPAMSVGCCDGLGVDLVALGAGADVVG